MDDTLHIVQHLYGEGEDPADLQRLLEDDGLRADYEALSEAKRYLDQRRRARPDPMVIDRIVAAAAPPRSGVMPGKRQDRAARPRQAARRFRLAGALSGVLALVLVVGIGLNQFVFQDRAPASSATGALMQEAPADAEAIAADAAPADANEADAFARMNKKAAGEAEALADEAGAGALAPATPRVMAERLATAQPATQDDDSPALLDADALAPAPVTVELTLTEEETVAGARSEQGAAGRDEEAAPVWDEAGELIRVHRRLDMVRARSRALIWDESAVMSLDSLPAQPAEALPGLNAASKKQRPGQQR